MNSDDGVRQKTGSTHGMADADSAADLPDDAGLAGLAIVWTDGEGDTHPGIVRGTHCPMPEAPPRVLIEVDGRDHLVDTSNARVEVQT